MIRERGGVRANEVLTGTGAGVATIANLPTNPTNGEAIWVETVRDFFVAEQGSAVTVDGITVINYTGGQWIRQLHADESWSFQATWAINATLGNDENSGVDSAHALKTWAELQRRIDSRLSGARLKQATVVTLFTSLPEYLHLMVGIDENVASTAHFLITSDPSARTPVFTSSNGSISGVTPITRGTGGGNALTITDVNSNAPAVNFANFINTRFRLTSGANIGAMGFVSSAPAATQAILDPVCSPIDPNTFIPGSTPTEVNPAIGDQYVLETLPSVYGCDIMVTRYAGSSTSTVIVDSIQMGPGIDGTGGTSHNNISTNPGSGAALLQSHVRANRLVCDTLFATNVHFSNTSGSNVTWLAGMFAGGCNSLSLVCISAVSASNSMQLRSDVLFNGAAFNPQGGVIIATNGIGIFNSTTDGVFMPDAVSASREVYISSTATIYGNGNAGFGANLAAGRFLRYENTRPTVTGASGDFNLAGQKLTWPLAPIVDFEHNTGIIQNDNAPKTSSVYLTGVAANITATNLFSANPAKGMYDIDVTIENTVNGAAGDTVSVVIAWTDARGAQSSTVITAAPVSAGAAASGNVKIRTTGAAQVTYALTFAKTGTPQVALGIAVQQVQSAGS